MTATDQEHHHGDLPAAQLFQMGLEALEAKKGDAALKFFRSAVEKERQPLYLSQLALCLAQVEDEFSASVGLCQEAVKKEPKNSVHFLRLGMIYLYAGQKREAIRIFRLGLRLERNPSIIAMLRHLGERQHPVIPFLARSNPLNKYLGKLRKRLGKAG